MILPIIFSALYDHTRVLVYSEVFEAGTPTAIPDTTRCQAYVVGYTSSFEQRVVFRGRIVTNI